MQKLKRILALVLVACMILGVLPAMTAAAADEESNPLFMEITSGNYLSTVGSNAFNVFMYDNTFSGTFGDQHMGGIELSLNNLRIATNGDLHMLPTPEQWDATPAPSRGTIVRDKETQTITVPMTFTGSPDGTLKYNLIAYPTEDSLVLQMVLQSDMPEDLKGKARFNLEFLPSAYQNKSYQADLNGDGTYDSYGTFPMHAQDAMVDTVRPNLPSQTWYVKDWNEQRGDAQPVPFATAQGFSFAQEDKSVAITVTSQTDAELELLDGRNRAQNGWYVLSTLITATKAGEVAISWNIKPEVEEGWVKAPLVTFSQVGYAPSQEEKFAVVELDKWDNDYPADISLWRLNADGSEEMVCEKQLGETSAWQRFKYARFDFSEVNEVGLYRIHYNGEVTEVFPIAEDAYDNIWQTTLDGFLAVQMDHIEVREGYKIWHGASHMDDCYLNPSSSSGWYQGKSGWFDGMGVGSFPAKLTEAGFAPDTHVDGLNKGGWFDAGDFDLQMSRNFSVLNDIINAAEYCGNMDNYDNLYVEWNDASGGLVEMHRPDGVPDVIQQAIHGSKQQLAQYEVLGGCGGCMEVRYLRQYTHLGDPSSDTDGYIYDPSLADGEIVERDGKMYSSVDDDRFLLFSGGGGSFSTSMSGRANNFAGVAYLAAPYYPDYAAEIFNAATKIWKDENLGNNPAFDRVVQYTLAAFNLEKYGIAYNDQDTLNYAFFKGLLDERLEAAINGGVNSNMALLALIPVAEEMGLGEDFKDRLEPSVASVAASQSVNSNVFGLNPSTGASWGGSPNSYSGVRNISFMLYNFPNVEGHEKMEKNILRSVNYLLGRHPASNASWISGVGTKSSLHPYNSNRAEESYIPGSILPGHITFNDFVETMGDHFNFLWFENESIINYQSSWLPVGLVAGKIGHKETAEEPVYAPTKDFESNLDLKLVKQSRSSYYSDKGFDVFMYDSTFSGSFGDQHNAGIELVQNGRRVATNGDIFKLPTPEQWDSAKPANVRGTRTYTEEAITVPMTIPAETFTDGTPENPAVNYQLIAEPEEGGVKLTVKLDAPLPADLVGKAGFNLEFLPAVFVGKSFMADSDDDGTYDSFGVFPLDPASDMEDVERARTNNQEWYVQQWNEMRGNAQPKPFATGTKMTFAAEDDDYRIRITSDNGLALYDGRNRAQNGWFVLRTVIEEGETEIVWHISPDVKEGWTREPNITHSQVGYEPALSKVAVIELDPNYVGGDTATLKRLNADGSYTDVFTAELTNPRTWKRYAYKDFDFSEVTETGMYVINYDGFETEPFAIDKHVYANTWQQTLSNYLAVQMDHIRIREGYKIWRNAPHMEDALQAPTGMNWFDAGTNGKRIDTGYEPYEHIPGLNVGGFCDAGDFDIQTGSNLEIINTLAVAYMAYGNDYDTLDVDYVTNNVELHRPDGIPDVVELVRHGALNMAAQQENIGFLSSVIEVPTLRQYTHLGDGSKDTDGLIYNPELGEDEVYGQYSGKLDDRMAFAFTKNSSTQLNAMSAISAAAAVCKDFDAENTEYFVKVAKEIWDQENAAASTNNNVWYAALNLYKATGEQMYKDYIDTRFDTMMGSSFRNAGWRALFVLDELGEEYKTKFDAAVAANAAALKFSPRATNPFGFSDAGSGWGGAAGVINGVTTATVLATYYPELIDTTGTFQAMNYILGTHPVNSVSYVSGVGTNSVNMAYGSNRAEKYYIAGGVVPGYCTLNTNLPEYMEDFNFLWFEHEYTINAAASWVLLAMGAEGIARNTDVPCEHNYTAKVTEPTCTRQGYTTYFCENCFDKYVADYTDALGHDFDDGAVTKPALATFDGIKTYTCVRCGVTYDEVIPAPGTCDMSNIDLTDPASANRIIIDNQADTKIVDGTGLYLVTSSGSSDANTAKDLVKIPVKGDWTATVKYNFEGTPSSGSGWFRVVQNFVCLAMDDYNNAIGIQTTDSNNIQDYKRLNGVTAGAAYAKAVDLTASENIWFKIAKEGDDYTYFWSVDGEEFEELFKFEDTGMEARCIALDAYYTGFAWGTVSTYKYNVESVSFQTPAPEYKLGPTVIKDPESPTGYTVQFVYFNDEVDSVTFCGDLMLSNYADPTDTKLYTPFEYKPGMMRRGNRVFASNAGFSAPMESLGDGYWFYELPLTAGANQYWFTLPGSSRMQPDPANAPLWSPASNWDTKNAYNAVYVPYDEKQDNELLAAREIENPREGQNNGTWSYVPYTIGEAEYYMGVYLPYGYDAEREEPYKTVYVLHGGGQDESDWLGIGSVQNIVDNLYADGRIEDAPILIVPGTGNNRLRNANLEATFAFVEENYNVSTNYMDRAICGLSAGSMMTNNIIGDDKNREDPSFGFYGLFSGGQPNNIVGSKHVDDVYLYTANGLYEGGTFSQSIVDAGANYYTTQVAGAHDFNTWCQLFADFVENYIWQPAKFYRPGPVCIKDANSPTGYTGKFIYFDDSGEQVYFCGDLMLSYIDEPGRNAATYSPFDYQPGMMRRGGSQFKEPMVDLGDGYWMYKLPLTAGANQYWFNTETNTRMLPDPANHPQWSPASNWNTKNAYNAIYVPYDAKQDNEVLAARVIENPRARQNNGTWSYVPYKLNAEQADDYYMGVYLPYGYDADREEPYKTIYVLHGGGQDESDWLGIGSVQNIIDNLYADGRIEDAPILIVPRNSRLRTGNLEATFAFVEENYNVSSNRMDRAICGLSMGGMTINSILGDDKNREEPTFGYYGLFSGGQPSNALTSKHLLDSYYYVGNGLYEGNIYNQNLVDSGASYHFAQFAGAHDFNTWCQMFTDFVDNYAFQPDNFERKLFDDVDADAYYYDAVKWAVDNGITNGFEPGIFAPDNTVTRAQIVTMLWRAAGCPAASAPATFKDVKAGQYYADAVAWAVENGITNGMGKNMFAPNDTCTRGQIVTFLWRYMGKPAAEAAAEFTDVPAGEYYADAVAWAVEAEVTTGFNDGTFKPANDCTRAQAVTFLMRALAE